MSATTSHGSASPSSSNQSRQNLDAPEVGGYRAIFGADNKKSVPKWVPVALLAFSTVAMTVPILMLRRQRAATLGKALAEAPPPPTRRSASMGVPIANPTSTFLPPSQSHVPGSTSAGTTHQEDNFNGALHCAKAFGIATLLVGVGATTTVWGVRRYLGVETTQEFADRMRMAILDRMPGLSARIHRPPAPEDGDATVLSEPVPEAALSPPPLSQEEVEQWTWAAAEGRLKEAFEKDGFSGWAAAALRELEAEGCLERTKRGHV
ncbi:hypothetical protein BN946_scf185002.g20 [Trametes cinnabarina]|uniref:Altered inheritance of mitochondria protein 11 n=1 Tax=Pycnoporus cinnabarinus TaxID=5643 RepID=A0A060SER8_PYCCI|nr:hypothetical protein BN946_scf185002.g20 [Trametes cinnabarina]